MKLCRLSCAAASGRLHSKSPASGYRVPRILVADDDPMVRMMVSHVLTRENWDVTAVEDGQEALQVCSQQETPFDLVILDIKMPGLNGYQTREVLQKKSPGIPCLFVSGFSDETVWRHIVDQGLPYLEKPFMPQQLVDAVKRVLAARTGSLVAGS